jgi:hypothetical protein
MSEGGTWSLLFRSSSAATTAPSLAAAAIAASANRSGIATAIVCLLPPQFTFRQFFEPPMFHLGAMRLAQPAH